MPYRELGQRIKKLRLERGLTQAELAEGLFDRSYISQIELGLCVPPLQSLQLIVDRLEVPLHQLVADQASLDRGRLGQALLKRGLRTKSPALIAEAWEELHAGPGGEDLFEAALAYADLAGPSAKTTRILGKTYLWAVQQDVRGEQATEVMIRLGNAYFQDSRFDLAETVYSEILQHHPRRGIVVRVLVNLGSTYYRANNREQAMVAFADARDRWQPDDGVKLLARCLHGLAICHRAAGDHAEAVQHIRQSLALYQGVDDLKWHEANHNLGVFLADQGRYEEAERHLADSLAYYVEHRHWRLAASALEEMAHLANMRGHHAEARLRVQTGLDYLVLEPSPVVMIRLLQLSGRILAQMGDDRQHETLKLAECLARVFHLGAGEQPLGQI